MRKALIAIILIAAVVFVIFLAPKTEPKNQGDSTAGTGDTSATTSEAEQKSESKLLSLVFEDANGNDVTLADFSGTPLVVNSWAIWCPFCVEELKDFAAIQQEFGDRMVIVSINRAESKSRTEKFLEELGVAGTLEFWLDPKDSFYKTIGGFSMPETVFITADGELADHKRGFMDQGEMRQRIQQAFDL